MQLATLDSEHTSRHQPIMVDQVLSALRIDRDGSYFDGTAGSGGHARAILEGLSLQGRLYACDRDADSVERVNRDLQQWIASDQLDLVHATFDQRVQQLIDRGERLDGLLLDLGLSSDQLDDPGRGFGFTNDGPLDMRMDRSDAGRPLSSAADLLGECSEKELTHIFKTYGDEPRARAIAKRICRVRDENGDLSTTSILRDIIVAALRPKSFGQRQSYLARNFQALRIAVNDELNILETTLALTLELLKPGGRLVVLSFHSLEDRIVKQFMRQQANPCSCPSDLPVCACDATPTMQLITRKPLRADQDEINTNPRSRSALLRVAERLP